MYCVIIKNILLGCALLLLKKNQKCVFDYNLIFYYVFSLLYYYYLYFEHVFVLFYIFVVRLEN